MEIKKKPPTPWAPRPEYQQLADVYGEALAEVQIGKGQERHAVVNMSITEQPMVQIGRWLRSTDYQVGQAVKKAIESKRLPRHRARLELLGAINYLAAAVLVLDAQEDEKE
jgi:hypothetical protein